MKNLFLIAIVALMFIGCEKKQQSEKEIEAYKVGDIITLKGVEGGERKLKRIKGGFEIIGEENKVLVIDFFGTFCPPCQKEASALTNFQIKYNDKVSLIGLTYLENVSDKYVVDNFSDKYNAHYFISNTQKINNRLAKSVIKDIAYPQSIQLPFKVVLKNGKYQILKDVWYDKDDVKFYIGAVGIKTIEEDMKRILGK